MAKKKSRQTFEKLKREQAVREKRARKQERKEAARLAKELGLPSRDLGSLEDENGSGEGIRPSELPVAVPREEWASRVSSEQLSQGLGTV